MIRIAFDDSALGRQLWAFNGPSLGLHEAGPSPGLHWAFTGSSLGLHQLWAFGGPSALGLQLWATGGHWEPSLGLHWDELYFVDISSTFRRHRPIRRHPPFRRHPPRCRRIAFHRHFLGFRVNRSRVYAGHLTEKTGMGI